MVASCQSSGRLLPALLLLLRHIQAASSRSATATTNCALGQYRETNAATHDVVCAFCPGGKYGPNAGSGTYNPTTCKGCPSGYYSALGWSTCTRNCPPGSYNSEQKCVTCQPGRYQPLGSQRSCIACPAGKHSSSGTECSSCPKGKYSEVERYQCENCAKLGEGADGYTVKSYWSPVQAAKCEQCVWCLPGACMPKSTSPYCNNCQWGNEPSKAVLKVRYIEAQTSTAANPEWREKLEVNEDLYNVDDLTAPDCEACCGITRAASQCLSRATEANGIVNDQNEFALDGMCSVQLTSRACRTSAGVTTCESVVTETRSLVSGADAGLRAPLASRAVAAIAAVASALLLASCDDGALFLR